MLRPNRLLQVKMPGLTQIIPVMAILMEVLWVYAWMVWISGLAALAWTGTPLNFLSCAILAIATELLAYFSLSRKWSLRRVRTVVLLSSFLLLMLLVRLNLGGGYIFWNGTWVYYASKHTPQIVVGLLFGVYFIWRGISVGRQQNTFSDIYRRFLFGLAGIVILLVIWGISGGQISSIWSNAGIYTVLFFGVGLLTLAIANLETLRVELLQHQEAASSFSRRWLSMLIALVLAILGMSIAVASIFSSNIASTLVHGLAIMGNWLLTAFLYALYPIAFIASLLYYVAKFLLSLITHGKPPEQLQPTNPQDWQQLVQNQSPTHIPDAVLMALKWGLIALVVVLIVLLLARILVRFSQNRTEEDIEEVHETLWSWRVFSADLRFLIAWLFRWMRRRRPTRLGVDPLEYIIASTDKNTDRVFTVRELYRALLWEGRQIGSPRRISETPYEYRRRLMPEIEKAASEVDSITEAYILERYGGLKTEPEKLRLLNRLWHSLRFKLSNQEESTGPK
jgi:hypothetical protein